MKNNVIFKYIHKYRRLIFLLLWFSFQLFFAYNTFEGFNGGDDIGYAKAAKMLIDNNLPFTEHHHAHRLSLIFLLSVAYFVGGIQDLTSVLPSVFTQFLTILSLFVFSRKLSFPAFITAVLLGSGDYYQFLYINKIFPDSLTALFFFLTFMQGEKILLKEANLKADVRMGFLMSLWIFLTFLSKETVLFAFPALLLWSYLSLQKKKTAFFTSFFVFSFLFLFAYFSICYILSGDIFLRESLIEKNSYVNNCSYHLFPSEMLKRVSFSFPLMLTGNGMLAGMSLVFGLVFFRSTLNARIKYWFSVFCITFLACMYQSISAKVYLPMCLEARHYLLLLPLSGACCALIVDEIYSGKIRFKQIFVIYYAVFYMLLAFICLIFLTRAMTVFWGAAALSAIIIYFSKYKILVFNGLIFVLLLIRPINGILKAKNKEHFATKFLLQKYFNKSNEKFLIYTDDVLSATYDYFWQFETPENIQFKEIGQYFTETTKTPSVRIFFLIRKNEIEILRRDYGMKLTKENLEVLTKKRLIEEKDDVLLLID